MNRLSKDEIKEIEEHGLSVEDIENQLENFKKGFPYVEISSSAGIGNGILAVDNQMIDKYEKIYHNLSKKKTITKFVPASGAATRMFKEIFSFLDQENDDINPYIKESIDGLRRFAFYSQLGSTLKKHNYNIEELIEKQDFKTIFRFLIHRDGLNYGDLPKALLSFHRYGSEIRTALEEHFVEGINYGRQDDETINLHFTISPEHREGFEAEIDRLIKKYKKEYGVEFRVGLSEQKPKTDTIAIYKDGSIAKNQDGSLTFRPAGHGALLENLNEIESDIIFIKNIDNISVDRIKSNTYSYKKLIAGLLLDIQEKIFSIIRSIKDDEINSDLEARIRKIKDIIHIDIDFNKLDKQEYREEIIGLLDRPIRVCAMVKNEGEPGGGPFWVKKDGKTRLAIVEGAEIDLNSESQKKIFDSSTHFNPVDLVCAVRNHRGERFNLIDFRDENQGLITNKSLAGREIIAQELPGLWNGSMADWISVFVEIPIDCFSPVKGINDLLREEHQ